MKSELSDKAGTAITTDGLKRIADRAISSFHTIGRDDSPSTMIEAVTRAVEEAGHDPEIAPLLYIAIVHDEHSVREWINGDHESKHPDHHPFDEPIT